MTADLAHELRTPLATIQARIEALEDGVLPATPENLRVIGEEVERLARLLGELRSLNEVEAEGFALRREPLDLAEVARDAATSAEAVLRAQGRGARASRRRRSRSWPTATACARSPPTCSTTPSSSRPRAGTST